MTDHRDIPAILAQARALLQSGEISSPIVHESGHVGRPIAVLAPDGNFHSWFVPVVVGDRLASFFQFLPDLTLMRYSSFQRHNDTLEGCPSADSWTDTEAIRRRAQERARKDERVGKPTLSYDREPSRLAWAILLTSPDGAIRKLHVAGQVVWEALPANNVFE